MTQINLIASPGQLYFGKNNFLNETPMTAENWIAIVAIVVTLLIGIGGWVLTRRGRTISQRQIVGRGGTSIQAGRDATVTHKK